MRTFAAWLASTSTMLIHPVLIIVIARIFDTVHTFRTNTVIVIAVTTKARPPPRTAAWAFVVARQCIATRKSPTAFITRVGALTCM